MQLKLINISKIQNAIINLDGLTVIAGINDSGKSTVGKVLFSLIKAICNTKNYNMEERNRKIRMHVVQLYSRLHSWGQTQQINFVSALGLPSTTVECVKEILEDPTSLDERKSIIATLDINPQKRAIILKYIDLLHELLFIDKEPKRWFEKELKTAIEAEFMNHICTIGSKHSEIYLCDEQQGNSIQVSLENNKISSIQENGINDFLLNDSTFVESPLYIHLIDILASAQTLKEFKISSSRYMAPLVNYHVKDMAQKLNAIKYVLGGIFDSDLERVGQIVGGKFRFDNKTQALYWEKDGSQYAPVNVASGIKAFGVMQILMETQAINENKLLIWDEPENHLHPEWQIKIAQLFVELAKAGIPILVSSHSPYFIQGIRYFSEKNDLDKYVNYYLSEETSNGLNTLEEVTSDLNRIFAKLAQPMNEIINIGL